MSDNLASFKISLDKFSNEIPEKFLKVQKKIILEAMSRVIEKSPVDTGRFRANWNTAVDTPDTSTSKVTDPSGEISKQKCLQALSGMNPYDVVHISNNLDYARTLENGRSDQAPDGMVAITIAELETFIREVVR